MTATASGGGAGFEERAVFVRKATGLVRGWSVRDAFIYAVFAINLITLGWSTFDDAPFVPSGALMWAVIISGLYLVFQAITYAGLISVMPRAGGDYVWMSRVLGGGIGFVLAVAGWWFILWYWVPIYAHIFNIEVLSPLCGDHRLAQRRELLERRQRHLRRVGDHGAAGVAVHRARDPHLRDASRSSASTAACFALAVLAITLLVTSHAGFINDFNRRRTSSTAPTGNAYAATMKAGTKGYVANSLGSFHFGSVLTLIPFMLFFNLWSNWGATLYGEVRGASDFRKNIYAMGGALLATTLVGVIFFLLFAKTFGWGFYNNVNNAFWAGSGPARLELPVPGDAGRR